MRHFLKLFSFINILQYAILKHKFFRYLLDEFNLERTITAFKISYKKKSRMIVF